VPRVTLFDAYTTKLLIVGVGAAVIAADDVAIGGGGGVSEHAFARAKPAAQTNPNLRPSCMAPSSDARTCSR
jgi:hypothetical protein